MLDARTNEDADAGDSDHGPEGDGTAGVVVYRDEVDEEGGPAHQGGHQERRHQHLPQPGSTTHPEFRRDQGGYKLG